MTPTHARFSRPLLFGLPLICSVTLGVLLSSTGSRAQETISITKNRLQELERQAELANKLAIELEQARAEIARLMAQVEGLTSARTRRPAPVLAPEIEKAAKSRPPTPAIEGLPPVRKDEQVSVHDLINHYAANPAGADQRYRRQVMRLQGIVAQVDKNMFTSTYTVVFRVPGQSLRVVCQIHPPEEFTRVYVDAAREKILGESSTMKPRALIEMGSDAICVGRCNGLKDGVITLSGCTLISAHVAD